MNHQPLLAFFALLLLLVCNACETRVSPQQQSGGMIAAETASADTLTYESSSIKLDKNLKLGSRSLSDFASDPGVPNTVKALINNPITTEKLDSLDIGWSSLLGKDNNQSPFYFYIFTQCLKVSDGAASEIMGLQAKEFAEEKSRLLSDYFLRHKALSEDDLESWVIAISGEISIANEGEEKIEVRRLRKKMLAVCSTCTEEQRQWIERFIRLLNERFQ